MAQISMVKKSFRPLIKHEKKIHNRLISTATAVGFFLLTVLSAIMVYAGGRNPSAVTPFRSGESMVFRIYYHSMLTGRVTAGYGTLNLMREHSKSGNGPLLRAVFSGGTTNLFSLFYKVESRFESFFDENTLKPTLFIRRSREGRHIKDDDIWFDYSNLQARSRTAITPITPEVRDLFTVFYYARSIPLDGVEDGQIFHLPYFIDDSTYNAKMVFVGRETVNTALGQVKCLKIKPMVVVGDVFTDAYPMILYLSDDKNRVPVLIQSDVQIGSLKIELIQYSGLANPFSALLD